MSVSCFNSYKTSIIQKEKKIVKKLCKNCYCHVSSKKSFLNMGKTKKENLKWKRKVTFLMTKFSNYSMDKRSTFNKRIYKKKSFYDTFILICISQVPR